MTTNKIQVRLSKIEESTIAANKQVWCVYIPALAEESDEQAVQNRLSIPE